jgi:hypothetical protein
MRSPITFLSDTDFAAIPVGDEEPQYPASSLNGPVPAYVIGTVQDRHVPARSPRPTLRVPP